MFDAPYSVSSPLYAYVIIHSVIQTTEQHVAEMKDQMKKLLVTGLAYFNANDRVRSGNPL